MSQTALSAPHSTSGVEGPAQRTEIHSWPGVSGAVAATVATAERDGPRIFSRTSLNHPQPPVDGHNGHDMHNLLP